MVDTVTEGEMLEISEGIPGAIRVLFYLVSDDDYDISILEIIKSKKIYGSKLWLLFKDVAGHDIKITLSILKKLHESGSCHHKIARTQKDEDVMTYLCLT